MSEGFVGNAATFELFFWLCKRYKIETEKDRIELLRKLVAKKRLKYERDGLKVLEGKSVLSVRRKKNG